MMDIEERLDSSDSQDSRLKTLTSDLKSFKRHYSVKPLNGESQTDIADIASVVQTIKAVSAAYQGAGLGDCKTNMKNDCVEVAANIGKSLNKLNTTEIDEPDSKRVRLSSETIKNETDIDTDVDKTHNGIHASQKHLQQHNHNPGSEHNKTHILNSEDCSKSISNSAEETESLRLQSDSSESNCCSIEKAEKLRLKNELSPEKCDPYQDSDLNEKVRKPEEDYVTPVKTQKCSSDVPRKSPFLIGDKIRQSLKGIVEKVKSSPDHKRLSLYQDEKEEKTLESIHRLGTTELTKNSQEGDKSINHDNVTSELESSDIKSARENMKICDRDDKTPCNISDEALVQSDSIVTDTILDQSNHIPVDSVRLKEKEAVLPDTVSKNYDEQDLLLSGEDDTPMDVSSDREDELLQENTSDIDLNNESVVYLGKETQDLNDKSIDLISKRSTLEPKDNSVVSGNLEDTVTTNVKSDDAECNISYSNQNDVADRSRQNAKSDNEADDDVIFEMETSIEETKNQVNSHMETSGCESKEMLDSNKEPGSKTRTAQKVDSNSVDTSSQCTEKDSICEKEVETTEEDDIIFEGIDKPQVKGNKESKTDNCSIETLLQDKSEKGSVDLKKDSGDEFVLEPARNEAEKFTQNKINTSTDSDISFIEDDSVICGGSKNSNIGTAQNEITASKSVALRTIEESQNPPKADQCDSKTGDSNVAHSDDTNEKKSKVDNFTVDDDDDDDDDDVIFEGVVKSSDPKTSKATDKTGNDEKQPLLDICKTKSGDSETEFKADSIKLSDKSVSGELEQTSETKMRLGENDVKNSVVADDDDDVIFEGVDKPGDKLLETKNESIDTSDSNSKPITKIEDELGDDSKSQVLGNSEVEKSESKYTKDNKPGHSIETKETKSDSVKSDTKLEEKGEVKTSLKRPAEANCEQDSNPKRTRLDEMIGKLGSQIGVEPESIEVSESDDDDDEEESATDTALEEKSEDTSDNEDDETSSDSEKVKYIKITEQELDELVKEKVAAYLASQRETLIAQLTQKVKDLQISNEQWKAQVKELQVKVTDVTLLQQKHEKRKAATAALKQITTRSVAVQVDEGKTASTSKSAPQTPTNVVKTPPRKMIPSSPAPLVTAPPGSNGTIRLPIPQSSIAPPVLSAQMPQLPLAAAPVSTANFQTPTVKSLLDTTRQQITSGSLTKTSPALSTSVTNQVQYPSRVVALNKSTFAPVTHPSSQVGVTTSVPVIAKSATPTAPMTSPAGTATLKIIDLTMDDTDNRQPKVVTLPAAQVQTLNQLRPVLAPQQGQQFVLNSSGHLVQTSPAGTAGQPAFQLVFNSTAPTMRTGAVTVYSSLPQTGSVVQAVSQQNMTSLATVSAQQVVTGHVPGQTALKPSTSSSQITSLLSQTKSKEVSQPSKAPLATLRPNMPDEHIRPALRKKICETSVPVPAPTVAVHPAPLPPMPANQQCMAAKLLPPKPSLKISRVSQGIVLSWNMTVNDSQTEIASYQLFAYQEGSAPPSTLLWKKVGDVKALPLPMACTLTQFQVGNKYHFSVRAVDVSSRVGPFSDYSSIHLTPLQTPGKS